MTSTPSEPLVSVVMPAYNVAWCVGRAVDSVLAQDFRPWELIVVNDGSTDGTGGLLERYGAAITVINQENRGMSAARNAGIRRARGTYVAFLDADDWWLAGKLSRQVELMRGRPEIGFSSTTVRVEDDDGRLLNLWRCPNGSTEILPALRGHFWRSCLAGVYTDYAKPAYRAGRLGLAYADTLRALMLSPLGRGRLCLGLLRDFLLRKPV